MTTSTFYSSAADGYIESSNATYATARAGSGLTAGTGGSTNLCGQILSGGTYVCWITFLSFDTSAIPDTDEITSVTLSLDGSGGSDASDTDFTMEARIHDWGAGLTTADWVAGADLSGKTLVASRSTSGWSTSGYNAFASESAFLAAISKTGTTYVLICSSRMTNGTAPSANEYLNIAAADQAGTTHDPKLVVEHIAPTGTVAASIQPLTASLAGVHKQSGVIAASIAPLTAVLTGWHEAFGTIAATLQPLTALAIGVWRRGGTNVPLGARASARLPRPGTGKARRD